MHNAGERSSLAAQEAIPLTKLLANIAAAKAARPCHKHRFVALLSTGSFAPVHKMHFQIFEAAKEWLENNHGFTVVGGWMSPSHDSYVTSKLSISRSPPINAEHRLAMCRLAVAGSPWVDVSSWEAHEPDFLDFPDVMQFHHDYLKESFAGTEEDVTLMYLGGADLIARCGPVFGLELCGGEMVPVVAVGRPGYTDSLREMVDAEVKWAKKQGLPVSRNMLYIVPNETLAFSSTKVRELLEQGESVAELCGKEVEAYLRQHNLHDAFRK